MENDRLINFCHPKLCSTVSCNTCSSDSYEETNLLSSDPAKFRRGFMADRFIKPPVEINVIFKCPVNLSHILLWPRVGQQKSSGFEVISNFTDGNNPKTERISSCYLSENDENVLFFCPRKFRSGNPNHDCLEKAQFTKRPFTWVKMSAISNVKSITLRILRTNGSSVPALGKIEIWGQPGYHTTAKEKKDLQSLWEQRLHGNRPQLTTVIQQPCSLPSTSSGPSSIALPLNIPEEFLDAVTFEMMSIPMVLPSGKVVDQRTLERHQDSEANWGRAPSDPFTGRQFSSTLHPVLDTALKSRIDHFLVVHQDREELHSVPRTVGRKSNCLSTIGSPRALEKNVMQEIRKDTSSNRCQKPVSSQRAAYVQNNGSSSNSNERSLHLDSGVSTNNPSKRASSPEVTILSEHVRPNKSMRVESNNEPVETERVIPNSFDDDFDDVLRAVYNVMPSLVNVYKRPQGAPDQCSKCESKENLFKLPCKHLTCRVCLLEISKSTDPSCYDCHTNFTSNQPVRHHPSV